MASDSATTEEQGFGQPEASRRWERILSQEERVSRFDRWVEFLSAVILSLATVATAWCAYQASLWDGDQADHYALASVASVRAAELSNEALQRS